MPDALIVSILALVLSVVAVVLVLYHQYWRKPGLRLALGDRVNAFRRSADGRLGVSLPLTFFNDGARMGAVVEMTAAIVEHGGSDRVTLRWDQFEEPRDVGEVDRCMTRWVFAGFAETLLVPPRSAMAKRIQFLSDRQFDLVAGDYRVQVTGFSGSATKPSCRLCAAFTMTPELAARWYQTASETGRAVARGSVELTWTPASDCT